MIKSIITLISDYCGVVNESSVRTNFALIYELIDEAIDFGFPQTTESDKINPFICNKPIISTNNHTAERFILRNENRIVLTKATSRPISTPQTMKKRNKEEILIDISEKLIFQFDQKGNVIRGELNGRIKIKSFLNKTTQVEIGFTPIIVGKDNSKFQYQKGITIDDCNFHANCDKTRFERQHIVSLFPPKGEFDLMNYRMSSPNLDAPFRIIPKIDNIKKSFISLKIKVQSNFSEFISARNVLIYFNVPDEVINIPHDFSTGMEQKLFFEKQKGKLPGKLINFLGKANKS